MEGIARDVAYALRSLARSRSYVAVALTTLALGIGATTAVFSVVRGVLLRPLPYPEPTELVRIWELNEQGGQMGIAWSNYQDWRAAESYDALGVYSGGISTVLGLGQPLRVGTASVSHGFFDVLGVPPVLGRFPAAEEHQEGVAAVAVVSEGFWRTHLGGRPDPEAAALNVNGRDVRVIGVVPDEVRVPAETEIWYPVELSGPSPSRTAHNFSAIGRLSDGVTVARADTELDAVTARFAEESPEEAAEFSDFFPHSVRTEPLLDAMVADSRRTLWVLFGAAMMLLLVACTNLASMSLARTTAREREVAVRRSLGAGQLRVARLLFVESVLLALGGGTIGVLLAAGLVTALPALAPSGLPRVYDIGLDPVVLGFALIASIVTAVLFGVAPALRGAGGSLETVLRSAGGRGSSAGGRDRLWSGLVVAEVALALLLLTGAGLLARSLTTILGTDPGFRTDGVIMATLNPPPAKYAGPADRGAYYERMLEELRAVPGVEAAGLGARPPLAWMSNGRVDVRGGARTQATGNYQVADAGYFRVLGIPVRSGRLFESSDRAEGEHVVVVSEAFAAVAWPGEDPVGKQMTSGGMDDFWDQERWATVVGVVGDIRQYSLKSDPQPIYYFPLSQRPYRTWSSTVLVQAAGPHPGALIPAVRDAIRSVDPDVPAELTTLDQQVSRSVGDERFALLVLALFAVVGLILAVVGVYDVVSYSVARRTRELGIRIALGARPATVQALVQRRSLTLAGTGLGLGIAGAIALTRVLESLLHGVSPTDPMTFGGVVVVMAGAAFVAGWIPARRTARIDPIITMQGE